MKKTGLLILLICVGAFLAGACFDVKTEHRPLPRCDKFDEASDQPALKKIYAPLASNTCVAILSPFDQAAWWESNFNSRQVRGEDHIRIGCTHCPFGNRDCKSFNNCGGCGRATLYFDLSRIQEDAEIVSAKIAVFALTGKEVMAEAIVEGRLNVGGDFAVVADSAVVSGNWLLFDITPFACRAVVERRNSVSFDISLPCGSEERARIAKVLMSGPSSGLEPALIVEFR
jgi:hypothetical protein